MVTAASPKEVPWRFPSSTRARVESAGPSRWPPPPPNYSRSSPTLVDTTNSTAPARSVRTSLLRRNSPNPACSAAWVPQHISDAGTKMRMFGVPYRITSTVTALKPGALIEWRHPFCHRWRWEFERFGSECASQQLMSGSGGDLPVAHYSRAHARAGARRSRTVRVWPA
jgi:hypothetical protein